MRWRLGTPSRHPQKESRSSFLHCFALMLYTDANCDPADLCTSVTHAHTDSKSCRCASRALPPLSLQVKNPTRRGHSTQPSPFLPILQRISGVHEALWHPLLLSLANASLLVTASESRACQEPCLGATRNDKMGVRARGWHMVLISSGVYRGPLTAEHNQTSLCLLAGYHAAHADKSKCCSI